MVVNCQPAWQTASGINNGYIWLDIQSMPPPQVIDLCNVGAELKAYAPPHARGRARQTGRGDGLDTSANASHCLLKPVALHFTQTLADGQVEGRRSTTNHVLSHSSELTRARAGHGITREVWYNQRGPLLARRRCRS